MGGTKRMWRVACACALAAAAAVQPANAGDGDLVGSPLTQALEQAARALAPLPVQPPAPPAAPAPAPTPAPGPEVPAPEPLAPPTYAPAPAMDRDTQVAPPAATGAKGTGAAAPAPSNSTVAGATQGGDDGGTTPASGTRARDRRISASAAPAASGTRVRDRRISANAAQADDSGGGAGSGTADPVATGAQQPGASNGVLPFTGLQMVLLAVSGLIGIAGGLALRRAARPVTRDGA